MKESDEDLQHPHDLQAPVPALVSGQVIRELSVLKPWVALAAIGVEWFAIAKVIALSVMTQRPGIYLFAVIWIGARQHALSVLGHDAVHYRLLPNKKWNDWIADLFTQWPIFLSLEGFREFHGRHHRFLGEEGDGNRRLWRTHNAQGELTATWTFPKTRLELFLTLLWRASFVTGLFWIVRGLVAMVLYRRSWLHLLCRVAYYGLVLGALAATGNLMGLVLYWIVPYCTWHMVCQYMRLICEHSAVHSAVAAYAVTRTTLVRRWEQWLILPRNINYHIEHHWFPSVPFYNLPRLHEKLMEIPEFRENAVVTRSLVESLRQCVSAGKTDTGVVLNDIPGSATVPD